MQEIFDQEPRAGKVDERVIQMWRRYGPFNLKSALAEGKIKIDASKKIVRDLEWGENQYSGQEKALDDCHVGRTYWNSCIQEGVFCEGNFIVP